MAKLKTIYEKKEDIPEGFEELFTERGGKFELTGVEGVKTQADIDRVQEGLRKEKQDHKATKDKLAKWGELDPETVPAQIAELEETKAQLEAAIADGKVDPKKNEAAIEAAVKRALGPVERTLAQTRTELENTKKQVTERDSMITELNTGIRQGKIDGTIRDAAIAAKVVGTAIDDAVLVSSRVFEIAEDGRILTRDNVGITPGLTPAEYFKDMQEKRPHWWPQSVGGGSSGAGGRGTNRLDNPWTKEGWNVTRQGQVVKQVGAAKAAEMAKAAGVSLGAVRPAEAAKSAA